MEASKKLLIFMAILAFIFALLVLFGVFALFWDQPIRGSQTDCIRKREARGLFIQLLSQLILSIIPALLALALIILTSRGSCDTACDIVLDVSLTCVNGYQVRNYH